MPTARHEMPQEYQGMRTTNPPDTNIWEGPLPVPRPITPRTPKQPLTDITPEMFWEFPETNPRTPTDSPHKSTNEAYEAYKPYPGHQVEMTPEEPEHDDQVEIIEQTGHQVEMTYPAPSHQVEMAYPNYMSWYKPSNDPDDHQVEMVEPEPVDYQVEIALPKEPSCQVEMTQTPATSPAQSQPQTSGGGWSPPRPHTTKQKPSSIPKMKGSTMKDLDKYNKDFKKFQECLIGKMLNTDNTIKAYLHWLDLGLLHALKADGQKQKTLAGWQLRAKLILKRTEKEPKKTQRTPPLEQLKHGAAKLPQETHHKILKELALEGLLPTAIHCQVMAELAHNGVLEGQEFAQTIQKLGIETMYIPKQQALRFKCEITVDE